MTPLNCSKSHGLRVSLRRGTLFFLFSILLAGRVPALDFASGADISWLPQMEAAGVVYRYDDGTPGDLIYILKSKGFNAIRLRTWVNPNSNRCAGHCSQAETIAMAQRVKAAGMRVMINFHYGDTWNDVGNQNAPAAWRNLPYEQMRTALYDYTYNFCVALNAAGVTPEWIQLGNETDLGICGPTGSATAQPAQMTGLLMAGYTAIKSIYPQTSVLLHVGGPQRPEAQAMIDAYRAHGGQWDITGYSSYASGSAIPGVQAIAASWVERYGKPIMQLEVGGQVTAIEDTKSKVQLCIDSLKRLGTNGRGIFYWEPATNLCNYSMSAWDSATQKATAALDPFLTAGTPLTPIVPRDLSAESGKPSVALTWSPSASSTHYRIRRATTSGGPYVDIATTETTQHIDADVTLGTTYFYVVSGFNTLGESGNSEETSATPLAGRVTVSWRGDGAANVWETRGAPNWSNAGELVEFVTGYDAVFDDAGAANSTVNIAEGILPSSVAVNASANYAFIGDGALTGAMGFTKNGVGTLVIGTANTFTGPTEILGGTLQIAHPAALKNSIVIATAGTLSFGDITEAAVAGLAGSGEVELISQGGAPLTLTLGATNASTDYAGGFTGPGALVKTGTGTLTLTGTHTLGGNLALNGGILRIAGGAFEGAGSFAIEVGTTLAVDAGTFTMGGRTRMNSATILLSGGQLSFDGGFSMTGNGNVFFTQSGGVLTAPDIDVERSTDGTINYARGLVFTGGTATLGRLQLGSLGSNGIASVEGGSLTVVGPVTVGSQTLSGRGGAFRITSGRFNVEDTTYGLILSKVNGANANNVVQTNFLGGISTVGRITFGYDNLVNAGSGTVAINGGELYLGAGGIVKNATSGMASTVNFTTGVLGAAANWTTSHPIALAAAGAKTIKAANEQGIAFDITLAGVLSGSGSVSKAGGGTVTLTAANTFSGSASVNAGTLAVNGSLAAGGSLNVNDGGALAGTGTINKAIVLNSGGVIAPAGAAVGTLNAASLTWNGGGRIAASLGGTSDRLALSGAFTKGSPGAYEFMFDGSPVIGTSYTVATFGSTTFAANDFSYSGLSGQGGTFSISGGNLIFTVTEAADAAFNAWAASLPEEQRTPQADADGDGIANLLEFALGSDGASAGPLPQINDVVNVAGEDYPTVRFTRRVDRGGVTVAVLVSTTLDFSSSLGVVEVSATPLGDGLETVVVRSAVPLSVEPRQFFRITASLP